MSDSKHVLPTLAICGSTGAGKSSLVNALVQAKVQDVGVEPTTKRCESHETTLDNGIPVFIMDTPGIGEAKRHEEYSALLLDMLAKVNVLLWVVGFDNRAVDLDVVLLKMVREHFPKLPILIIGNAVDRASKRFHGQSFDHKNGTSDAEKTVRAWLDYLSTTFAFAHPAGVLACSAGESHNDSIRQYNLSELSQSIEQLLPQAMRLDWLSQEKTEHDREEKAKKMILGATTTAGAVGLVPLPIADMPVIITIQVSLILGLATLYGRAISKETAKSLALTALSAVAGPMIFQALVKVLPILGSLLGAGVAAACTYAVGTVTHAFFASNSELNFDTFTAQVKDVFKRYRSEHK